MVADEMRREADQFVDVADLGQMISRDLTMRSASAPMPDDER